MPMNYREIATDLLTPLGAYLRLREGAPRARSCSSRSSAAGSGGTRSSAAARGSSASTRPRRSASRSSATSATTSSRGSSRRCRSPTTGPGFDESRFVVPELLVRFDHARGVAEVLVGDPARRRALLDGPAAGRAARHRHARRAAPLPRARRAPAPRRAREGAHPRGRRLPGRDRAARRAADLGVGVRALPRAPPGESVSVSLPARARRRRARRQLAGDGRQVRGHARAARQPDRRHDRARRGRRRGAPRRRRRTAPST